MENREQENSINSTDITKIVSKEISCKTLDLGIDYSELALDEFLKDGVLKEIPFVKSVVSFYNIGHSIIDRHKTKKILTFFKEFHSSEIKPDKLGKFKQKFDEDIDYQNQVVETITLLNERFLQIEKSKILAKLIISHIEEKISWDELTDLTAVLDNIHPKGFLFLDKMAKEINYANHSRDQIGEALMFACGIGHRHGTLFMINELGKKFYENGLKT
jgi:hypothetical protein